MDYKGNRNVVGARIRAKRRQQKITQTRFAIKLQLLGLNLDNRAICSIEKDKRAVFDYELPFFARALDVTVLWLLGLD